MEEVKIDKRTKEYKAALDAADRNIIDREKLGEASEAHLSVPAESVFTKVVDEKSEVCCFRANPCKAHRVTVDLSRCNDPHGLGCDALLEEKPRLVGEPCRECVFKNYGKKVV